MRLRGLRLKNLKRCALIGELSSALWLAENLKRVTEMLRPYHIRKHTASPWHGGESYAFFFCINI